MSAYALSELTASNPNATGRRKRAAPEPGAHHIDFVPRGKLDAFFDSRGPLAPPPGAREQLARRLAKGWRR